ncbi:hypothetical protein PTW37_12795 [Arthrobacter agilis]|uniref:hypothetical protein n=1 Tax=Arthrobacter agilis TaxID=37921 RepID=UPI002366E462|nr:hypothetical protein [Arthrobacter agilis]WDF32728.1 hypothetical protein PTW37_12795 [Arthrobacter agilis]
MSYSSRLNPEKDLPEDLSSVDRDELDILNSRNHRDRDLQYIRDGDVDAETEGRHHDLREELDRRQADHETALRSDAPAASGDAESAAG